MSLSSVSRPSFVLGDTAIERLPLSTVRRLLARAGGPAEHVGVEHRARSVDADDVGAKVGEHHCAGQRESGCSARRTAGHGAWREAGEFDDADASEWVRHREKARGRARGHEERARG